MALTAVQILTDLATGAATALGAEAGEALADLVRARLGTSDRGRAALAGLGSDPADPSATQGLQEAIREALVADPDFRHHMTAVLAGPPPAIAPAYTVSPSYANSIVIGSGSKVRRSQISLGPLTVNNTRSARGALVGIVAVLLALLALGGYGAVQLFTDDDSPGRSGETSGRNPGDAASSGDTVSPGTPGTSASATPDGSAPVLLGVKQAWQILPDAASLPDGWKLASNSPTEERCRSTRIGGLEEGERHYICRSSSQLNVRSVYEPGVAVSFTEVQIEVLPYTSIEEAAEAYLGVKREQAAFEGSVSSTELEKPFGDESAAVVLRYTGTDGVFRSQARSVVRSGTVVAAVNVIHENGGAPDIGWLSFLTEAMADRTQQALDGEVPTASVGP
ncbi:hypothetical protein ACFT7S_06785 [Streptomyces sp. NPDC057136]|uniref:hypothetical protein n=1 Tax=Streptomyces sp. NPDC057136 TaxID=3346029 RepID=UPI00362758D3